MSNDDTTVTIDLGPLNAQVDQYAIRHGMTREEAAFALVKAGLNGGIRNSISGNVTGTVVQHGGDVHGNIAF
jgi:hypothetical protein